MTQEKRVATRQPANLLPATITKEQAMYLLRSIWPQAPDADVLKAAILCQQYGLNPLMRQIYLIEFNKKWVIVLGIKATRQIAQQALKKRGIRYSYMDGPRVMSEKEQVKIRGEVDAENIRAITILQDSDGNQYPGYGSWVRGIKPYGTDKGNDALNMAFIRSERNALEKLAPGELPDIEVGDDTYIEGDFKVALEKGQQQFQSQVREDIDELWPKAITPEIRRKDDVASVTDGVAPELNQDAVTAGEQAGKTGQREKSVGGKEKQTFIDLPWLKESQATTHFTDKTAISWLRSKANYQDMDFTGSLAEIVARMSREQAAVLVAEIEDRLKMA